MLLMNGFLTTYIHSGAITKIEFINSNMHRSEHKIVTFFTLELAFLQHMHLSCFCTQFVGTTKIVFFKTFSQKFSSNKLTMQK